MAVYWILLVQTYHCMEIALSAVAVRHEMPINGFDFVKYYLYALVVFNAAASVACLVSFRCCRFLAFNVFLIGAIGLLMAGLMLASTYTLSHQLIVQIDGPLKPAQTR